MPAPLRDVTGTGFEREAAKDGAYFPARIRAIPIVARGLLLGKPPGPRGLRDIPGGASRPARKASTGRLVSTIRAVTHMRRRRCSVST